MRRATHPVVSESSPRFTAVSTQSEKLPVCKAHQSAGPERVENEATGLHGIARHICQVPQKGKALVAGHVAHYRVLEALPVHQVIEYSHEHDARLGRDPMRMRYRRYGAYLVIRYVHEGERGDAHEGAPLPLERSSSQPRPRSRAVAVAFPTSKALPSDVYAPL